ncbi:MAG: cytochrome C [Alphaproteobacteria bacterium]|nr:cytochrome C [Alphaproteobacteria bacterium]
MFMNSKTYIAAAFLALAFGAPAQADERYAPVLDQTVVKECGACHMVFQPQMLPAKSWSKIVDGLASHFGEDASLDADTARQIKAYLVKEAADAGWWGGKFMRGLSKTSAPLRITETPYWVHEHNEEVPQRAWSDPKVKSKANCLACHSRADKGNYDDD